MKKVSICVPTYGKPEYVRQLLDSASRQTFTDYEVIITDDTDGKEVQEVALSYQDTRIRYYKNPQKLGHIFNWNRAIELAEGEYIKIMFSDDWFTYDTSLEEYVALLEQHPEAGFAFSLSMQVSDHESYARVIPDDFIEKLKQDYRYLFTGNFAGAPSGIIYRNNGIKFDEKSNWASDLELYLHLLSENPVFAFSERPLVSIGLHGEQYTNLFKKRDMRIFNDYYFMFEKYHLIQNEDCKRYFEEMMFHYRKSILFAFHAGFSVFRYGKGFAVYLWKNKVVDYFDELMRRLKIRTKI